MGKIEDCRNPLKGFGVTEPEIAFSGFSCYRLKMDALFTIMIIGLAAVSFAFIILCGKV